MFTKQDILAIAPNPKEVKILTEGFVGRGINGIKEKLYSNLIEIVPEDNYLFVRVDMSHGYMVVYIPYDRIISLTISGH
jgi:hypothetical protein